MPFIWATSFDNYIKYSLTYHVNSFVWKMMMHSDQHSSFKQRWCDYCSEHEPDLSSYMDCLKRSLAYLTMSIRQLSQFDAAALSSKTTKQKMSWAFRRACQNSDSNIAKVNQPLELKLIDCWSFASWQHSRSYQDGYRHLTIHTYNCLVLPNWETVPPAPWPDIPLSHIILTLSLPVLVLS